MIADKAKNISQDARNYAAIEEQYNSAMALIEEAAREGKNEITLPYSYTFRSVSNDEFNLLIGALKQEGFKPHFEMHSDDPHNEGQHILDRFIVSISWK